MVLRYPTRVSQHDQPSLSARPPPRMPASEEATGRKTPGWDSAFVTLENGHDSGLVVVGCSVRGSGRSCVSMGSLGPLGGLQACSALEAVSHTSLLAPSSFPAVAPPPFLILCFVLHPHSSTSPLSYIHR